VNRPIALVTDFGTKDHYVGSLKAVIYSINPKAQVFDITHELKPQNIREGAFVLNAVYPFLPKGAIVAAVVDPGVGSERQAICVRTARGFLIGPNNGIFTMVLQHEKKYEVRAIANDRYFMKPVSATFHGRDIFAPSAAHLSKKDVFRSFGPHIQRIHQIDFAQVKTSAKSLQGEIIYVDRFGNAFTNISKSHVYGTGSVTGQVFFRTNQAKPVPARTGTGRHLVSVEVKKKQVRLKPFFSAGAKGSLIAVWNSSDLLELAVREDSAEKLYGLHIGDPVVVRKSSLRA
jgi:S-adenosylmethionine hydrolase